MADSRSEDLYGEATTNEDSLLSLQLTDRSHELSRGAAWHTKARDKSATRDASTASVAHTAAATTRKYQSRGNSPHPDHLPSTTCSSTRLSYLACRGFKLKKDVPGLPRVRLRVLALEIWPELNIQPRGCAVRPAYPGLRTAQ